MAQVDLTAPTFTVLNRSAPRHPHEVQPSSANSNKFGYTATDEHLATGTLRPEVGEEQASNGSPQKGSVSFVSPDREEDVPEKNGWQPRLDLPTKIPEVPALSVDLIPAPLQLWLSDAAERMCVPLEFIAVSAITSMSALVGRSLGIFPKQHDNWLVTPNLWGMVVGQPSSGKSPASAEGSSPLKHLATQARAAFEERKAEREAETIMVKLKLEKLKRSAISKKGDLESVQTQLGELMRRLQELEKESSEKRYLTNDATTEKLAELLIQNPRGLLVMRDELMGLLTSFSKQGREGDRAFYLEAWSGLEAHSVDRIGRGSLHVPAVILSVLGGIQPGKLMSYVYETLEGKQDADGLLQRFQLLVYPDGPRAWKNVDRSPNQEARARAFTVFERIDTLDAMQLTDVEEGAVPALRFTTEAQELFNSWLDGLMIRVRSAAFEQTPAFQAHLAKYPSLFASLALLFHLVQVVERQASGRVSLEAAKLARSWCSYLEEHAKKIYAPELNTAVLSAYALKERIEEGDFKDELPLREIYRRQLTGLRSVEQLANAIKVLEKCNWACVQKIESGSGGGRPSEILRLHPELRKTF